MKNDIFHLQIILIKDILVHEEYDEARARPLIKRIKEAGYLANPIIVASLNDHKYLQLDGMNRLSAFRLMGKKSIVAQVIDYNDQEIVELSSWTHLFHAEKDSFINYLKKDSGISVKSGRMENIGHRYIREEGLGRLCTMVSRDRSVYLISTNGNLADKIKKLHYLVSYYKKKIIRDVLPCTPLHCDYDLLFKEHPCNIMIVFPTFTRHQIMETVRTGQIFPAGVTRHIVKRRCLSVNIPLGLFDNKKTLEDQNNQLEKLLSTRPFRVYEEPTVFFE